MTSLIALRANLPHSKTIRLSSSQVLEAKRTILSYALAPTRVAWLRACVSAIYRHYIYIYIAQVSHTGGERSALSPIYDQPHRFAFSFLRDLHRVLVSIATRDTSVPHR